MKILNHLFTLLIALSPTVALANSNYAAGVTSTGGNGKFYVTGLDPHKSYTVRIYQLYYGSPTKVNIRKLQLSNACGLYEVGKLNPSASDGVYEVDELNQSPYEVIVKVNLESDNSNVITFRAKSVIDSGASPEPSCP